MSQLSKMRHSRDQWKDQAKQRGQGERYARREQARIKAQRDQLAQALKASETRVCELEAQSRGRVTRPKVDVVHFALQLFLEARISSAKSEPGAVGLAKMKRLNRTWCISSR